MYLPWVIIKRWQCSRAIRSISRVPHLRDARAQKEAASRVARLFLEINGRELYRLMASLGPPWLAAMKGLLRVVKNDASSKAPCYDPGFVNCTLVHRKFVDFLAPQGRGSSNQTFGESICGFKYSSKLRKIMYGLDSIANERG
jgi:hypothetical protein